MKKMKLRVLLYGLLGVLMFGVFYLFHPPINIQSGSFRLFLLVGLLLAGTVELIASDVEGSVPMVGFFGLSIGLLVFSFVVHVFNGPIIRSEGYSSLISIETKDFDTDFPRQDVDNIPLMNRSTASELGSRQIGSLDDSIRSQFIPDDDYTQINIDAEPFRVTPLEHRSFFTWRQNREGGIPHYLEVDMVTGNVEMIDIEDGMKYSHSDYFGENVDRYLRFQYPTTIFQNPSFEVDDNGHPYYVATTYEPQFFWRQEEPTGVITLDAITGKTEKYDLENTPSWVDRIYSADLIMDQLNYYGRYTNGTINRFFAQQGVTETTDGYNYVAIEDDIYLYTGVTSANSDASNVGFYLVNMRTKEADFYPVSSADEHSAMSSAEGTVQETRYSATFPLLMNLDEHPYFMMSLIDDNNLVRMYALVDVEDYQRVLIDSSIDGLIEQLLGNAEEITDLDEIEEDSTDEEEYLETISGIVERVEQAVVSGDTIYYFLIDGLVYKANINLHDELPFIEDGMEIEGETNESYELRSITIE